VLSFDKHQIAFFCKIPDEIIAIICSNDWAKSVVYSLACRLRVYDKIPFLFHNLEILNPKGDKIVGFCPQGIHINRKTITNLPKSP
jgi:hypothetical protein